MPKITDQLAKEMGELLAASTLDKDTKKIILEYIGSMPEDMVFQLKDALENEQQKVELILAQMEEFLQQQEESWKKLESEQQQIAEAIGNELFEKLKDAELHGTN